MQMIMKEFIADEKARLQKLFDEFNAKGSWMEMREGDDEPLDFGLIDSYIVTRVAPHFDSAGNLTKTDFWLMFKSAGYNNGFQYTHTIKIVDWSQEDTYLLDFADDRGRRFHIELLFPTQDVEMVADWKDWQRYKTENRRLFDTIDTQLLEEHNRVAEEWDAA
jgi:hypothetical protein